MAYHPQLLLKRHRISLRKRSKVKKACRQGIRKAQQPRQRLNIDTK